MPAANDTNQIIFIGIIYLIAGIYGVWLGIAELTNSNIKIPGLYHLGIFISNLVIGKNKTAQAAKDTNDPEKRKKRGVALLFCGILFLGGGLLVLFGPS